MSDLRHRLRPWLLPLCAPMLIAGILLGRSATALLPCLIAAAASCAAAVAGLVARKPGILLLTAICCGMLLGYYEWHPELPQEGYYDVTATVADEVIQRKTDTQIHTWLTDITLDGKPYHGSAYWSLYNPELPDGLEPGARISVRVSLYEPSPADNEDGFDFREYCRQHGAVIGLYGKTDLVCEKGTGLTAWIMSLRHALSLRLREVMGEEAGGYASAMLLGLRSQVSSDDREDFNALGVGHILSVSGFHVGILCAALLLLMKLLRVPPGFRAWIALPVLAFYCVLSGGNAPVIRASILCLLALFAKGHGLRRSALHILAAAATIQLCFDPVQLTSAGFQLSYCAMLGLTLVTPTILRADPFRLAQHQAVRKAGGALWKAFAAAAGAQIGVLLPQLYWYQELPLLGILSNMLLITLASFLLACYWICLLLMFIPVIGTGMGTAASWLTSLMLAGVRSFGSQDWLLLWTKRSDLFTTCGWLLILGGLCCLFPRRNQAHRFSFAAGIVIIVLSLIPWSDGSVTYTQFSVGAADAAVIADGSYTAVIDTGETSALSTWLRQRRRSVDALFLTHLHSDHILGLQSMLNDRIPVRTCYISSSAWEGDVNEAAPDLLAQLVQTGTRIVTVGKGDVISLPSGSITVLWPEPIHEEAYRDANDGCLVLLAELKQTTLLLTGDLTSRQ